MLAVACFAQQPEPLPIPAMTGPLQTASPISFDAGPFGKLDLTGVVSGVGVMQAGAYNIPILGAPWMLTAIQQL